MIKEAKITYDHYQIIMNNNNKKKLSKIIKSKLRKKDMKNDINFIYVENYQKINDPNKISNFITSFFSSIGCKINANIQIPFNSDFILPHIKPNTIFNAPTTENEIKRIVHIHNGVVDSINAKTIKII